MAVDKVKVCAIARKLQFYKMFYRIFLLLLALSIFTNKVEAQNYVRFSKTIDSVYESQPRAYIYVECNNTTTDTFRAVIALNNAETNVVSFVDFFYSTQLIIAPPGLTRDTTWFESYDNDDYDPGKKASFVIINLSDSSFRDPDSTLTVNILNDDPFQISFVGAGRTVVESDTTVFIRVACNGVYDSATTAKVKLDAGSAIKGKHFLFNDTTVTIAAFSRDTVLIPVVILNDTIVENTREANFTLYDVSNSALLNIRGFTLTIRDDDLQPSAVVEDYFGLVNAFPNPASSFIQIVNLPLNSTIDIFDFSGKLFSSSTTFSQSERLDISDLAQGFYLMKITNQSQSKAIRFSVIH